MHLSAMKPVAGPPRGNALLSIFLIWVPALILLLLVGIGSIVLGYRGTAKSIERAELRNQSKLEREEKLLAAADNKKKAAEVAAGSPGAGSINPSGEGEGEATTPAAPVVTEAQLNAALKMGKSKYIVCQACHGVDGKGQPAPGVNMAPNFADSKIAADPSAEAMTLGVLKGIKKENGSTYLGVMMPLESALKDKEIAAVLTYVRHEFVGLDDFITEEEIKGWRAKYADVKVQASRAEVEDLLSAEAAEAAE